MSVQRFSGIIKQGGVINRIDRLHHALAAKTRFESEFAEQGEDSRGHSEVRPIASLSPLRGARHW